MNAFPLLEQNSNLKMETIGTLNLKIARLERRLQLLNQQQLLSHPYPDHKVRLAQESYQVRFQLDCLKRYREKLLQDNDGSCMNRRSLDGDFTNQGKTNFSFN